jgi:serine/threonine protein kinase
MLHIFFIVLQIADQMLERVDTLHSRHLIHRDIKPVGSSIATDPPHLTELTCFPRPTL